MCESTDNAHEHVGSVHGRVDTRKDRIAPHSICVEVSRRWLNVDAAKGKQSRFASAYSSSTCGNCHLASRTSSGIFALWGKGWIDAAFGGIYLGAAVLLRNRGRLGAAVAAVPLFIKLDFLLIRAFAAGIDRPWAIDLALNLLFAAFVVRAYQAAHDSRSLQRSESVFGV